MAHNPKYDRFSVWLHWLMAALLIAQIALGLWMIGLPKGGTGIRVYWFNVHKSIGMSLGLLLLLRLAWVVVRPRVAPVAMAALQQVAARAAHGLLYLLMLLMPLSGFLGSVFSGYPIRFFGMKLPQLSQRWDVAKEFLSHTHQWGAYALIALIALHLLAFAHHQFILKDKLILRMR